MTAERSDILKAMRLHDMETAHVLALIRIGDILINMQANLDEIHDAMHNATFNVRTVPPRDS